jgi:hypothetical protein
MTEPDRDPLLERLRAIDPADADPGDEARIRARVILRGEAALDDRVLPRWRPAPKLVLAGGGAVVAAVLAIVLFGGGDSFAPGPGHALAIERTENGVQLTIANASASANQMNRELAEAGIDRVRVISVPGSPNHAGTWGGTVQFNAACEGGPTRSGFGIRIAYHPDNGVPAPGQDFVDLRLPQRGKVVAGLTLQRGAGKRAVVSRDFIDNTNYAPAILVAIHARTGDEPPDAKRLAARDLIDMGGVFAPYGEAMADGHGECSELDFEPLPPPTFPPAPADDWAVIRLGETRADGERMTEELQAAGIQGRVRMLPAQRQEVGTWMGFKRVPAFGPDERPHGNVFDILLGDPAHPRRYPGNSLALRHEAFAAYPDARWVFFVGRRPGPGEAAQTVGFEGPTNAARALEDRCKATGGRATEPDGDRWCPSVRPGQIPRPDEPADAG